MVTVAIDPAKVDHVETFPWGCIICLVNGVERQVTCAEGAAVEREMEEIRD